MPATPRLCVFTGSSPGRRPAYREAATRFGTEMVARGYGLVYGGGRVGLMGAVADAVLAAGGSAVGVLPEGLVAKEVGHAGLDRLEITATLHERKSRMAELAAGFVALPGGMGTLDELAEALTWAQLGIHSKPIGLLNVDGYYDRLLDYLDIAAEERFLRAEHREMLLVAETPGDLIDRLESYRPVDVGKWLDRDDT